MYDQLFHEAEGNGSSAVLHHDESLFALWEWTWMNISDSIGLWFISLQGIKEVTLLGQNVNSYRDMSESQYYGNSCPSASTQLSPGFSTVYRNKSGGRRFSELLDRVSQVDPEMRIRFTSPHPKDFPDEVSQHTLQCRVCNMIIVNLIWAATWQNQQNECAPSEDSDQPGNPPSLVRIFAVRSMGS